MRGSIFYLLVTVVLVLGLTSDSSEFQRHQRIVRGGSSGYFPQDRFDRTYSAAAFIPVVGWAVIAESKAGLVAAWALLGFPVAWLCGVQMELEFHTNKPVPLYMSNLRSRFIETAVRPLGYNAEMTHAAAEMLGYGPLEK